MTLCVEVFYFLLFMLSTLHARKERTMVIHAGPWKTGTTAIQAELGTFRAQLKTYEIYIPEYAYGNHHYFVEYFTRFDPAIPKMRVQKNLESKFNHVRNKIRGAMEKYTIISAESFSLVSEDDLRTIPKLFDSFSNFKVILFYRNPIAWVYSMYRQEIKAREYSIKTPISFANYLLQADPWDSPLAGYLEMFYKFEKVFGRENITIIDYDGFIREDISIMDAFFSALSIPVGKELFSGKKITANLGLDFEETHFVQLWRLFDVFAKDHYGCSTYTNFNWQKQVEQRSSLIRSTFMGKYSSLMPLKCLHPDMLRTYGLYLDRKFRRDLGERIIHGNSQETESLMMSYRMFCEIDMNSVLSEKRVFWSKIFRRQMKLLSKDNMTCGGRLAYEYEVQKKDSN